MAVLTWSVRFAENEADARALSPSSVAQVAFAAEVHGIKFSRPSNDDPGEPSTITFEIDAIDGNDARLRAQHLLLKAKRAAGLKEELSPVVWVALLSGRGGSDSGHRFLEAAEELIVDGRYDLAVVAAQVHLEAHVAALVKATMASEPSELVRAVYERQRGWAPHSQAARSLLELLLGLRMEEFPRWADYKAHVRRRNDVVHEGQAVDVDSAKTSVSIALDFWLWINRAAAERQRPPASGS